MSRFDLAPEVTPSSQPERRWADAEGLQQTGIDGKEAGAKTSQCETKALHSSDGGHPSSRTSRRKWVIILLVASVIAALGIGIGIGYAVGNDREKPATKSR